MAALDRLTRLVPTRLTARLAKHAVPIAIGGVVLILVAGLAFAALVSPSAVGITAARISETVDLPNKLAGSALATRDADNDGLPDALENYLYGTDPNDWNSSGTGIPDGWLAEHKLDPLSPLVGLARGVAPPPDKLPAAYKNGYPEAFTPPLSVYYDYGRPADYKPGVDKPWWRQPGAKVADPSSWDQGGSGIPTGWLLHYGLDPQKVDADKIAEGSSSNLTIRDAFEHNTDPRKLDSDADGLPDWVEIHVTHTDPALFSTTGTGIADGWLDHWALDPLDAKVGSQDPDRDGLTNLEEFVISYNAYRLEAASGDLSSLYSKGLNPRDWQTAKTGIPDGWYVRYGLSPFGGEVDRVIGKASDWPEYRTFAPEGKPVLPDLVMTVKDAYSYGRPSDWSEERDGVWWGGTNPATLDTDNDGIPDPVEIRGWYANVTTDVGPTAKPQVYVATSNPLEGDSDGDGLTDVEEYRGRADCGGKQPRLFPPTNPRNRDTAFSGLTDAEKVCGAVRGTLTYDLYDAAGAGAGAGASAGGARSLDPTRADTAGDYMRDGPRLEWWNERYLSLAANPKYPYNGSVYKTVFDWTSRYARFGGMSNDDVLAQFRPDGDADGDGIKNVLDADPSGGLYLEKFPKPGAQRTDVFFLGGPQMDPSLYKLTEFASSVPHSASDPANPDTDGDGLPTAWEVRYGRFSAAINGWDLDPSKSDSNGDGVSDADANNDGDIIVWYAYDHRGTGTSRTSNSFDFTNILEFAAGTNPNEVSTSGDGIPDGWKAFWGSHVTETTFPNLLAARDPRVGAIALEHSDAIEAAMTGSAIQPMADLAGLGAKSTGYVRIVNVTSCAPAEIAALLKANEQIPTDACFAGQNLDGKDVKVARIEGVSKLTYKKEAELRTDPFLDDSDGDGVPDAYEAYYMVRTAGGSAYPDPATADADRVKDPDGDGLGLFDECNSQDGGRTCGTTDQHFVLNGVTYGRGSDPNNGDSDLDGIQDGIELIAGLDPLNPSDVDRFRSNRDSDFDGIPDYLELSGWGKNEFDTRLRTDPKSPDTDGDGLLDGATRTLDPTNAADVPVIAWFDKLGIAHHARSDGRIDYLGEIELASSLRQETGVPNRPDTAFSVLPDVPDGWFGYYRGAIQNVKTVDASAYTAFRPTWWSEARHGVWWWGRAPGSASVDVDRDGLGDSTLEDPMPWSALDRVGTTSIRNPALLEGFVKAGTNASDVRERAQSIGDRAGDPDGARTLTATNLTANGVPVAQDRANVAVLDLALPDGTTLTKGASFRVTGRVVLDERVGALPTGALLEGDASQRVGAPNRTVLVGFFGPDTRYVVGVGVTAQNGTFALRANITDDLRVLLPPDLPPLGFLNGSTFPGLQPAAISAGTRSGPSPNTLVAWVLNTSAAVSSGDPTYGSWKAWLPKGSGGRAVTTHATAFGVSGPIDVTVRADTHVAWNVQPSAVNGGSLTGEVRLLDAGGAPLVDRPLKIRWEGAGSPLEFLNLSTDRDGSVNVTNLHLVASVAKAEERALIASFSSTDPYLNGTSDTLRVRIRQPSALTLAPERTSVVVGDDLVVRGTLLLRSVALEGGGATPAAPIAGATVRASLGSAIQTARTDDQGAFLVRISVPGTLLAGESPLVVSYTGSDDDTPIDATVPIGVKRTTSIAGLNRLEGPRFIELSLRGKLQDNEGQGFAGELHVEAGAVTLATGRSNDRGEFAIPVLLSKLPLGAQAIHVTFLGDAGHAPAENFTQARATSTTSLKVEGVPALVVRGASFTARATLLDDIGHPVPAQPVTFSWRGARVGTLVTDENGLVTIPIRTNATERPAATQLGAEYVPGPTAVYETSHAAVASRVVQGVKLTLLDASVRRGPAALQGSLADDEGKPILAAEVALSLDGKSLGTARVGRNGSFELALVLPPTQPLGATPIQARYLGTQTLASAVANATWSVRTPLKLDVTKLGPFVRGEKAPFEGRLVDDQGRPADAPLAVTLGDRNVGTVPSGGGKFAAVLSIPADLPRGAAKFHVESPATPEHEAFAFDVDSIVKLRPKVEVHMPAFAVRGFSFGGDVQLRDDQGQPLRNTTFVYVLGKNGAPNLAQTDAAGKATLAAVAPLEGDAFVSLTVKGSGDVVAAEYKTQDLRVVGPATPIGWIGVIAAVLFALLFIAVVIVASILRRRQLEEVRTIIEEAIEQLLAGNEYASTIFLAYRRLSAHLARHGFGEKAHETPREFAVGVRKALPVGNEPLKSFVQVFEEARYSDHAIGTRERDSAVKALSAVRGELDRILGRAPPKEAGS